MPKPALAFPSTELYWTFAQPDVRVKQSNIRLSLNDGTDITLAQTFAFNFENTPQIKDVAVVYREQIPSPDSLPRTLPFPSSQDYIAVRPALSFSLSNIQNPTNVSISLGGTGNQIRECTMTSITNTTTGLYNMDVSCPIPESANVNLPNAILPRLLLSGSFAAQIATMDMVGFNEKGLPFLIQFQSGKLAFIYFY